LEEGFSQEDPLSVAHEIEHFSAAHRIRNFSFYDEALLYNAESHLMRVLKHVLERKIRAYFHTPNGLHIKFISPELARLMKRAGFVQPRLGLETSSSVRQRETGGKVTNAEFLRAVNRLKDAGYESSEIGVNILIGLPGQSVEEARDTIHFAASRRLRLFLEEYSPIPHTPEYERSGLPADADPLLHNNSAFPLYRQDGYHEFQELKELAHRFNESIGSAYSVI
jgi:radical SAM superfamily enzyme YgiQ (UPF0313 family)